MPEAHSLKQMRADIARASKRTGDPISAADKRRDYAAAKLEDYIRRVVETAPPLTQDQRSTHRRSAPERRWFECRCLTKREEGRLPKETGPHLKVQLPPSRSTKLVYRQSGWWARCPPRGSGTRRVNQLSVDPTPLYITPPQLTKDMGPHEAALAYAAHGWKVFPIDHPSLPQCAGIGKDHNPLQTCDKRGKCPCVKFSTAATSNPKMIDMWWSGDGPRNVGVYMGGSNLLVVDEDKPDALARYAADHGVHDP